MPQWPKRWNCENFNILKQKLTIFLDVILLSATQGVNAD